MTETDGHPKCDLQHLLWEFVGAFTRVQDTIDNVVAKEFFDRRVPKMSKLLWRRTVKRINDEERVELLKAIAKELESDADLTSFRVVYDRAAELRNKVAHSTRVVLDGDDQLIVRTTMIVSSDPEEGVLRVDRQAIRDRSLDCAWLHAQAMYVIASSNVFPKPSLDGQPMEWVRPTARPEDWDGTYLQPRTNSS
ncbi:MAG: hypothetical protein WBA50_10765 [Mycobacterium sp.]